MVPSNANKPMYMLANLAVTLPLSVFPTILDGLQRFGAKSAVRLIFCP